MKINCFKTNEAKQKCDTFLLLLLFTKSQREKNVEKTFFVNAGVQIG